MKKLGLIVASMAVAGGAYASTLAVPWFVDNAPVGDGPVSKSITTGAGSKVEFGVIILKSNRTDPVVCSITYFNQDGKELGPYPPNNTFAIAPKASVQFRPVASDPAGDVPGGNPDGIESAAAPIAGFPNLITGGLAVPNRPQARNFNADGSPNTSGTGTGPIPFGEAPTDNRKNGAISIEWAGDSTDVQGIVSYYYTEKRANGEKITQSYGTLLPPGT